MKKTDINFNGHTLTATYEYDKGEARTHDHPGSNPSVRLWTVENVNGDDITDTINSKEWEAIETMCYEAES